MGHTVLHVRDIAGMLLSIAIYSGFGCQTMGYRPMECIFSMLTVGITALP